MVLVRLNLMVKRTKDSDQKMKIKVEQMLQLLKKVDNKET